jgi:hypothetical protein
LLSLCCDAEQVLAEEGSAKTFGKNSTRIPTRMSRPEPVTPANGANVAGSEIPFSPTFRSLFNPAGSVEFVRGHFDFSDQLNISVISRLCHRRYGLFL